MNLSALTIQQLRYVVAVDQHRSFREAALSCSVTQPALSAQIKKVEDLLGIHLFDRSRQPIVPTDRGAQVVAQARIVLVQVDRIGLILSRDTGLSGQYRLGIIPTLAPTLVPLFLPAFAHAYPGVELDIQEAKTDSLVRLLREGALDGGFAVTPLDVPAIRERVVCHEEFYVYLSPGHPLATRERVHQSDLVGEQLWLLSEGHCFRTQVLHLCSADVQHVAAGGGKVRFDGSSFEALIRLVDTGFGVTVLPELVVRALSGAQRSLQVRRLAEPEPVREISFVQGREHVREDVADALCHVLREQIPQELRGRRKGATICSSAQIVESLVEAN